MCAQGDARDHLCTNRRCVAAQTVTRAGMDWRHLNVSMNPVSNRCTVKNDFNKMARVSGSNPGNYHSDHRGEFTKQKHVQRPRGTRKTWPAAAPPPV